MKSPLFSILLCGLVAGGCTGTTVNECSNTLSNEEVAVFTSSDKVLQKAYEWAKKTALSYSHSDLDPVGFWYEAALPKREAFCMRNVSHQSVGAQILGLQPHNKNMFSLFAKNISEAKDWCSYWEINRYNVPVPADYLNDKEFWYNLNANPDMLQACMKMYDWTGDDDYISSPTFTNFYKRSTNEYIKRWDLSPDKIMDRDSYMNISVDFDENNNFHACRGLPSYVEDLPGIKVGVDLIAALYGGFEAYSRFAGLRKETSDSVYAKMIAERYRDNLENEWWDNTQEHYRTLFTKEGKFIRGEGVPYILWFAATENSERIDKIISDINSSEWNVENLSHFPELFYRYGYCDKAYEYLVSLPTMSRANFPEVSFGVVEGCVCGVMGFLPSFSDKTVTTQYRIISPDSDSKITNIKVFDGYMSVCHKGNDFTEISNNTSSDVMWKASFIGDFDWIKTEDGVFHAVKTHDIKGNHISYADIRLPANKSIKAFALKGESDIAGNPLAMCLGSLP